MSRREWTVAVAAVAAWVGSAGAQPPQAPSSLPGVTSAPPAGESGGSVVVLRTAGQPERKVQVLKVERMPDGKILSEVRDLATGAVFTVADTKPLGAAEPKLPKSTGAPLPLVAPAGHAQALPAPVAATGNLPGARPRNYDPLLGGAPPANVNPAPAKQEFPTLVGAIKSKSANAAPQPASQPSASGQSAMSRALFGSYDAPPQPQPTLVGSLAANGTVQTASDGLKAKLFGEPGSVPIQQPTLVSSITAPRPEQAVAMPRSSGTVQAKVFGEPGMPVEQPTLMGKLFGDTPAQPIAAPQPALVQKQPAQKPSSPGLIRPNAAASTMPPAALPPQPQQEIPAPPVDALVPVSLDHRDPNFHVVPPRPMTMKQIEEMVKDLRMHHKPSRRLEAANELAASPMASMVEVRQILAEASYRDPVPVVRAHCIELLTKMRYDEDNYLRYVESLVNDDEPAVQRAARKAFGGR